MKLDEIRKQTFWIFVEQQDFQIYRF